MKKNYLILVLLLMAGCVWAADDDLYCCGQKQSSTSNWSYSTTHNIGDAIFQGSISYNASTKTVTFDGTYASVKGDNRIFYNKNVPGLKIVLKGRCFLTSQKCVFRLDCDTEIQGSTGYVEIQGLGSGAQCIYCPNKTDLTISDAAQMRIVSQYSHAIETNDTKVTISNSTISVAGEDGAIHNNKGNDWNATHGALVLNGCLIRDPWGNKSGSVGEGYVEGSAFLVHTGKAKTVMIIRDDDYIGVRLKGVALTKGWSMNYDSSNPSYGIEDYYTYDASTNTLTLKKDFMAKTGYGERMDNKMKDNKGIIVDKSITIDGDGHCVYGQYGMKCADDDIDVSLSNITIAGNETLGIEIGSKCVLTLKDNVIIGGVTYAISGWHGQDVGTVKFNPSFGKTVTLIPCDEDFHPQSTFSGRAIQIFNARLEDCYISTPAGAEMNGRGNVTKDGINVYSQVIVTGIEKYDLRVGSTQVTSLNASDILGNGQFKYNASTKTLTVTNATFDKIQSSDGAGIANDIAGLTVNFVGTNVFTTSGPFIKSTKSLTLAGNGSLTATAVTGIDLYGGEGGITCTISGPQLDITSRYHGISDSGGQTTLNVSDSNTRLALHPGTNYKPLNNLKALNIGDGLYISEPMGGYFSSQLKAITVSGTTYYSGDFLISNVKTGKLGISINGQEMTTLNMNNVPGVVSGSAYITLDSNGNPTLVLSYATLDWNEHYYGLYNDNNHNFTIKVFGDCTINAPDRIGIELDPDTKTIITGGGMLTINSKWAGVETYDDTRLCIQDNTKVIAESRIGCGYFDAGNDYGAWLVIENGGLLAAFGPEEPVSFGYRSPKLGSDIDVRYPVDAMIWNNYVYYADGSKVENDWVVIGPDTQATDELIVGVSSLKETKDWTSIYNLAGQRMSKMQKGINIVDGQKVLVK